MGLNNYAMLELNLTLQVLAPVKKPLFTSQLGE